MELQNNCTKNENQSKEPHKRQAGTQLGSSRVGETGLQGHRDWAAPAPPGREASAEQRSPPGPAPASGGSEARRYRKVLLPFHHPRPGPPWGAVISLGDTWVHVLRASTVHSLGQRRPGPPQALGFLAPSGRANLERRLQALGAGLAPLVRKSEGLEY